MKAVISLKYGPPKVLKIKDIEKPIPKENEALVRVKASSINSADLEQIKGTLFIRLSGPPRGRIIGSDMAGVVEAVGKNVVGIKVGDRVLADLYDLGFGAFAEYVCVPAKALSIIPQGISFERAATIPQAALCALQGLNKKQINSGDKVLINGAGGGMGSFAVQIAKSRGAVVTGVDRSDKFDFMRALGADTCIDFKTTNYTDTEQKYDLILDMNARHKAKEHKRTLTPDGTFVVVGGSIKSILATHIAGVRASSNSGKHMSLLVWKPNDKDDIETIMDMILAGEIEPAIDRTYKIDDVVEALEYCDAGNAKGKVVITLD